MLGPPCMQAWTPWFSPQPLLYSDLTPLGKVSSALRWHCPELGGCGQEGPDYKPWFAISPGNLCWHAVT